MNNRYTAFKRKIFDVIDDKYGETKLNKVFDFFIVTLILLNVLAIILESFEPLYKTNRALFDEFDRISILVFTIEYILRVWTAEFRFLREKPISSKIRLVLSPIGIIDLMAILPSYILMMDLRFIRLFRLTRLLRVLKLTRYSNALRIVYKVLKEKKDELMATVFITFILLLVSSTLMYHIEKEVHSDAFPNILSALWWAVATLTTIGYGDVYPVTVLGKVLSGMIAILGIGLVALPTGIISSGFLEEIRKKREDEVKCFCPHCGKKITE